MADLIVSRPNQVMSAVLPAAEEPFNIIVPKGSPTRGRVLEMQAPVAFSYSDQLGGVQYPVPADTPFRLTVQGDVTFYLTGSGATTLLVLVAS